MLSTRSNYVFDMKTGYGKNGFRYLCSIHTTSQISVMLKHDILLRLMFYIENVNATTFFFIYVWNYSNSIIMFDKFIFLLFFCLSIIHNSITSPFQRTCPKNFNRYYMLLFAISFYDV